MPGRQVFREREVSVKKDRQILACFDALVNETRLLVEAGKTYEALLLPQRVCFLQLCHANQQLPGSISKTRQPRTIESRLEGPRWRLREKSLPTGPGRVSLLRNLSLLAFRQSIDCLLQQTQSGSKRWKLPQNSTQAGPGIDIHPHIQE